MGKVTGVQRSSHQRARMQNLLVACHNDRTCLVAPDSYGRRCLKRLVDCGEVVEPYPRIFAAREIWDTLSYGERMRWMLRTLAHKHPAWVFCSFSAALMHGLPVTHRLLDPIHVCTSMDAPTRSSPRVQRHRYKRIEHETVDGVKVTPLVQTAIDCMAEASFPHGLAVADGLLRMLDVERELLEEMVRHILSGRKTYEHALACASWDDGRAESGGESIARAVMIEAGIAPTTIQAEYARPDNPHRTMRTDFSFALVTGDVILGELDGYEKYQNEQMLAGCTTVEKLVAERQRESRLTMLGMPVVRFTMRDVWRRGRLAWLLSLAGATPETLVATDYHATAKKPPQIPHPPSLL